MYLNGLGGHHCVTVKYMMPLCQEKVIYSRALHLRNQGVLCQFWVIKHY